MTNYYYNGGIGNFGGNGTQPIERKYTVIQSLWTKPIKDKTKFRDTMYICALSLAYAHRSGYKVHMHTDSKGYELLKGFGYEGLYKTLDDIPDSVPTDMFAAGKFYAMKADGITGKVHIDVDVFLKKPGVIDMFYENKGIDAICQQEEDISKIDHSDKIFHLHILGYPETTRPNWNGSMNTGIIGFNNEDLAKRYFDNYFEALKIYKADKLQAYKKKNGYDYLLFDFVLEQIQLSYMSLGHNVYTLLPTKNCCFVADKIGYQHLQGDKKWSPVSRQKIRNLLAEMDINLYRAANSASYNAVK